MKKKRGKRSRKRLVYFPAQRELGEICKIPLKPTTSSQKIPVTGVTAVFLVIFLRLWSKLHVGKAG